MDTLTPLDSWFLHIEDGIDHMHIGLVTVFEPTCPDHDDVLADVAARLDRLPRYRQKVRRVAGGLTSPLWVDDASFDLTNHVKRAEVCTPGDDEALRDLVGELISSELHRAHPLWELWVVSGLADGRWATVQKVHHCLTDGVGGAELALTLLDAEPQAPRPAPSSWEPRPEPSTLQALRRGAARHLHPLRAGRSLVGAPGRTVRYVTDSVAGLGALSRDLPPTQPTVLNGPLGPARSWWPATASMDDVALIRKRHDVTLNDIALTVIAGGFTDLLRARGEDVADRDIRSLVPVSLRDTGADGALHNRVSAMVADLPVGIDDPHERLAVVHERMVRLKASHEREATANVVETAARLPYAPIALGFRVATSALHRFTQRNINTVTTNVPGPAIPLYWMGCRIERAYPVVPIGESVRLGIAIFSYLDLLTFGVTADRSSLPDGGVVARGIERELAALAA